MTIEQMIKNSMAKMIERKLNIESVEVSSWEEEFEKSYFYGCDTCGHGADEDKYVVTIWYTYSGMEHSTYYRYEGNFADLIKELDTE